MQSHRILWAVDAVFFPLCLVVIQLRFHFIHPGIADREGRTMCGRYVIEDCQELSEALGQRPFQNLYDFQPNWNAAPSQQLPVLVEVDGSLQLHPMQWGLIPTWVRPNEKPKIAAINARSETLAEKPMFRTLVKHNRCLVPANGFYEWKRTGSFQQPFYIHLRHEPIMLMAGLYTVRTDKNGATQRSFTIITGPSNETMAAIHDRMPMIIHPNDLSLWLDARIESLPPLEHLLHPLADREIEMHPVSNAVNNARNNTPNLLTPIATQQELL